MVDVERQKEVTTTQLDRGYRQQQIADELLADADAARDTARKAVAKAEATLREANETLRTLRGMMQRNVYILWQNATSQSGQLSLAVPL